MKSQMLMNDDAETFSTEKYCWKLPLVEIFC